MLARRLVCLFILVALATPALAARCACPGMPKAHACCGGKVERTSIRTPGCCPTALDGKRAPAPVQAVRNHSSAPSLGTALSVQDVPVPLSDPRITDFVTPTGGAPPPTHLLNCTLRI